MKISENAIDGCGEGDVFSRQRCLDPDPVCPERLDPDTDPVCPERLDPDPVNIRPDPQPWARYKDILIFLKKEKPKTY